jgi:hypothetical protein
MWIRRLSEAAIVLALAGAVAPARAMPAPAGVTEDPLEQYRERFKQGMDRYRAGALAEAIGYWEPIYRELGEQKGYRLAYNLGVAYAELGDATRAAERLQAFLAEVDARRERSQDIATIVAKNETDARGRIAGLVATKGRIHIESGTPPRAAQVDASEPRLAGFVAWVTPGEHTVTFAPGAPEQEVKTVTVHAGEVVDVEPTPPPPPPAPTTAPEATPAVTPLAPPPPPITRHETVRPFSPLLLGVSGGLAVAATMAAYPLNQRAWSMWNPSGGQPFYDARTVAYTMEGAAIGLAGVTAALAAWYFLGTSTREVVVTPAGVAGRF